MFIEDADMGCLRQGDILKDVPYPLLDTIDLRLLSSAPPTGLNFSEFRPHETTYRNSSAWTCQSMARICFAAVISQCCDIEPRHGRIAQPTIALARLTPIPSGPAKDPTKLESLRANKNPLNADDPGYINLFHIPAHALLDDKEWVVDYNQVLSIPATEFPKILERKILQITDHERIKFKIKLAASFGRLMAEEHALDHPWMRNDQNNETSGLIEGDPAGQDPELPAQE